MPFYYSDCQAFGSSNKLQLAMDSEAIGLPIFQPFPNYVVLGLRSETLLRGVETKILDTFNCFSRQPFLLCNMEFVYRGQRCLRNSEFYNLVSLDKNYAASLYRVAGMRCLRQYQFAII